MADSELDRWNNDGSISLWSYEEFPKNYCGYHLTADPKGCAFLIGLVERFEKARYPARKRVVLDAPTADHLAIPNCQKSCIPALGVEFRFRCEFDERHWSITDSRDGIVVELGATRLREFVRGVAGIVHGHDDWAIGHGIESLWFWSHPQTTP